MVAIRSNQADSFIQRPPDHIVFWLVFGPDHGLVSERIAALLTAYRIDRASPFQLARMSGDAVAADPLSLLDEANAISLFGDSRVLLLEVGSKPIASALEPLIGTPPKDCKIIIEAGPLKRDAPLRKLLERERTAVSIECYPDGPQEIDQLIDGSLRQAGLSIGPEARQELQRLLGGDRIASRAEIEKLLLYVHGKATIGVEDIEAAIADASGLAVEAAINAAFCGDLSESDEISHRLYATGGDPNYLLASALRQAVGLHRAKLAQSGNARQFGLQGRDGQIDRALSRWSAEELERAIAWISDAIGVIRRAPGLAQPAAVRVLWRLARKGRQG